MLPDHGSLVESYLTKPGARRYALTHQLIGSFCSQDIDESVKHAIRDKLCPAVNDGIK